MRRLFIITGLVAGVILIMLGGAAAAFIRSCLNIRGQQNAMASGQTAEAQLVEFRGQGGKNNSLANVYYECYNNGIRYYGIGIMGVDGYDTARTYIGQTITIYIDGKGHSIPIAWKKPSLGMPLAMSIVFSTLFGAGAIATGVIFSKYLKLAKVKKERRKAQSAIETNKEKI